MDVHRLVVEGSSRGRRGVEEHSRMCRRVSMTGDDDWRRRMMDRRSHGEVHKMDKYNIEIQHIRDNERDEVVFQEPQNRHVIFPLKHLEVWRHYKRHMSTFWTADEVNLSNDIGDWKKLDEDVKEYLLKILAFFAASDGIVCENLLERFMTEVKIPEMKFYYTFQAAMENVHSEMYSQLIDAFEIDPTKKDRLFNAVEHSEPIGDKARWALRWIGGKTVASSSSLSDRERELIDTIYDYVVAVDGRDSASRLMDGADIVEKLNTFGKPSDFDVELVVDALVDKFLLWSVTLLRELKDRVSTLYLASTLHAGHLSEVICKRLGNRLKRLIPNIVKLIDGGDNIPRYVHDILTGNNPGIRSYLESLVDANVADRTTQLDLIIYAIINCIDVTTYGPVGDIPRQVDDAMSSRQSNFDVLHHDPDDVSRLIQHVRDSVSSESSRCVEGLLTRLDRYVDSNKHELHWNGTRYVTEHVEEPQRVVEVDGGEMPFALRLLAFIIVEGVFFSSSFAGIFWVRTMNMGLPGLVESNDFISRDEGLHTDFGILVYNMLKNRPSQELVHDIFREAVQCEINFTRYILPDKLSGMNVDLMSQYVRYVADRLCNQLGYDKIFNVDNPFGWMDGISVQGKANFFERTVTEYSVGSTTTDFGELDDF